MKNGASGHYSGLLRKPDINIKIYINKKHCNIIIIHDLLDETTKARQLSHELNTNSFKLFPLRMCRADSILVYV